jgi:proteasome assembly chaperone 3
MAPPPGIARAPFPARTTTTTEPIGDIPTTITATHFADKLLVTVSQDGRLAIWVRPPSLSHVAGSPR